MVVARRARRRRFGPRYSVVGTMRRDFGVSFGLQAGAQTCGYAMFLMNEGKPRDSGNKISETTTSAFGAALSSSPFMGLNESLET